MDANANLSKALSINFAAVLGAVSLFADMTCEGVRSASGLDLALLGATGAVARSLSGSVELLGYGLRPASDFISNRTRRSWAPLPRTDNL